MLHNDEYLVDVTFGTGYAGICNVLLNFARKQGKDIILQHNAFRQTALHLAIEQDRVDPVKLLASFRYDIEKRFYFDHMQHAMVA